MTDNTPKTLSTQKGGDKLCSKKGHINRRFVKKPRPSLSVDDYFKGIRSGNRVMLSQAITLIESENPKHRKSADELVQRCLPHSGQSVRVGVTGAPGVGKSTFIEAFGIYLTEERQRKIAILAIDPSSQATSGSILGDKTRMCELTKKENVFIRPSPVGKSLGGVAKRTREAMVLCEAFGADLIIVETVGVGQSELAVRGMVDFFLLLMIAGAGDELQGIKRGIMEMADGIAITKNDGDNKAKVDFAKNMFKNALRLFPHHETGWDPSVLGVSALEKTGISDVWSLICYFERLLKSKGFWERNRNSQLKSWMQDYILQQLIDDFYSHDLVQNHYKDFENKVLNRQESPFIASNKLIKLYRDNS